MEAVYPLSSVLRVRRAKRSLLGRALLAASVSLLTASLLLPSAVVEVEEERPVSGEMELAYRVARPAVVLVVDVSGSMADEIPGGVKIEAAREAALRFVEGIPPGVDLGLVAFSDSVVASVPPTSDRGRVREVVEEMEPQGGTMYSFPLMSALSWVRGYRAFNASCAVVMITDGLPADVDEYRPLLDEFRRLGVPVHAVFVGPPGGEGEGEIELIASRTGGRQETASTAGRLVEVLSSLSSKISETVARVEVGGVVRVRVQREVRIWEPLALAGLALYSAYWAVSLREEGVAF